MKKQFLITILLVILFSSIIYLKKRASNPIQKNLPTYGFSKTEATKQLPALNVEGYYPIITNVNPKINADISNIINTLILERAKEASDNKLAMKESGSSVSDFMGSLSLEIITPKEQNSKIISFLLRVTGFTGGAHGFLFYIPFNYDFATGDAITRDQVLDKISVKIENLSSVARPILASEMQRKLGQYSDDLKNEEGEEGIIKKERGVVKIDESMFNEGTDIKPDNYKNILIGEKSMDIYFEPYAVASWAEGEFMITIPYSQFPK